MYVQKSIHILNVGLMKSYKLNMPRSKPEDCQHPGTPGCLFCDSPVHSRVTVTLTLDSTD